MEKPLSKISIYIHGIEQKVGPFCDSNEVCFLFILMFSACCDESLKSAVKLCQKWFPALAHVTEIGFYVIDPVLDGV